ncbi:MAG: LysM peptidoglycan-binding domain-containing protein [Eubacteriaceae bacterium]|nr:LysM peptidoglycan-binding domain-containing protein [Eubacteriaceae bacterium]
MIIAGKRIRIVKIERLILAVLIATLVTFLLSTVFIQVVQGTEPVEYRQYIVKSGDTLWNIAEANSSEKEDVRSVVYEISRINHIGGSDHIYPNQALKIPVS